MSLESISLEDTQDGRIISEPPSDNPNQVTFIGTPNSSVNFGGGFEVVFFGGVFRTTNQEIIDIFTKLSKRGAGVTRLVSAAEAAAAKAADPMQVVLAETTAEGQAGAINGAKADGLLK